MCYYSYILEMLNFQMRRFIVCKANSYGSIMNRKKHTFDFYKFIRTLFKHKSWVYFMYTVLDKKQLSDYTDNKI